MVKSHGDFVTIIDLPEGEHQYKFFVDGEWRHDPGLVSYIFKLNTSIYISTISIKRQHVICNKI